LETSEGCVIAFLLGYLCLDTVKKNDRIIPPIPSIDDLLTSLFYRNDRKELTILFHNSAFLPSTAFTSNLPLQ
jgi:hypothetical protein